MVGNVRRVVRIAGEHLVAQRKAIKGDDNRNTDLLAVRPVIARITALRLRIAFGLALEIGARHVIEQHFVLGGKQLAAALRQMCFERAFVFKQVVERAIQALLRHLLLAELQQIGKCRPAVPILGDVQLARRLAQTRGDQQCCHLCPGNELFPDRQKLLTEMLKPGPAPQSEHQVHVPEPKRAFHANAFEANWNC